MGNKLIWQDHFNIGVEIIDKEHRKLFSILNRLLDFSEQEEKSQWVCQEGIKYFKDHAMKHFTEEEMYMASINYKNFDTHRRLHDDFRKNTLPALEHELEETDFSKDAVNHFLGVCAGWLIGHTLTEDRAITGKVLSKWEKRLPDEELTAMKQTITWLLNDMFQLKAQVISDHYGGEKFGKGIYYRLAYIGEKNEKIEIMLVFEEKLLLKTIGGIISGSSAQMNEMLLNATRYTARQFIERVLEHFTVTDTFEIHAENLLTYEQFQKIFSKQNPECSLLFDTKEGYFAYCAIAPQVLEKNIATSIRPENAMAEVHKYLKTTTEKEKKKVLLVDDSQVIRKSMHDLLCDDYEVSEASSGLAALRSIILDRPHLVILDYEMPVCNGRQVLEMIRAEADLANLPVMFLTGKVDKESVKQVMNLNPTGYLLKTLKPNEIKKNIDNYFKRSAK